MATPTRSRKTTRSRAGAEESLLRAPSPYIFFGVFGGLRYYPPGLLQEGEDDACWWECTGRQPCAGARGVLASSFLPAAGGLCWRMTVGRQKDQSMERSRRATTRVAPTMPRGKRLSRTVHSKGDPRGRHAGGWEAPLDSIRQRNPEPAKQ